MLYRPEFAENYHQGPTETHSDGLIVMPLPSFVDVAASKRIHHAPSEPSLKDTGNLIETESVLFYCHDLFCFVSLVSFLFAAKLSLLFLGRARHHPSINQRPIFTQVRIHSHVTLCLFLLSSILLPNQRLPMKAPTLGTHILVLIQDFTV